jgi:hypothetical protein
MKTNKKTDGEVDKQPPRLKWPEAYHLPSAASNGATEGQSRMFAVDAAQQHANGVLATEGANHG